MRPASPSISGSVTQMWKKPLFQYSSGWIAPLVRRIKELEKLNTDPVYRNHVGLKQSMAILTKYIVNVRTWIGSTDL